MNINNNNNPNHDHAEKPISFNYFNLMNASPIRQGNSPTFFFLTWQFLLKETNWRYSDEIQCRLFICWQMSTKSLIATVVFLSQVSIRFSDAWFKEVIAQVWFSVCLGYSGLYNKNMSKHPCFAFPDKVLTHMKQFPKPMYVCKCLTARNQF